MTRARNLLFVVCCAGAVYGGAEGQALDEEGGTRAPTRVDEEIVVRGRSRAVLRVQIQRAEEAVYARFNEINSTDEYDIFCRREPVTGSRMLRRSCRANLWREAEANAGTETVRALQGGFALAPQQFLGEALYKHRLMAEEMRELAAEDEELLQAILRLVRLQNAMSNRSEPQAPPLSTAARVTTGDEEALPYDATLVADVQIGGDPWRHALTRRTFTISNVYGAIPAIDLECGARVERLAYEPGAEWTLPDDWESCELRVEAAPGTTFSLYEFE